MIAPPTAEQLRLRLALAGADGSMEDGPHGFPLSFMNVLAQEHPSQAHVDVLKPIQLVDPQVDDKPGRCFTI